MRQLGDGNKPACITIGAPEPQRWSDISDTNFVISDGDGARTSQLSHPVRHQRFILVQCVFHAWSNMTIRNTKYEITALECKQKRQEIEAQTHV